MAAHRCGAIKCKMNIQSLTRMDRVTLERVDGYDVGFFMMRPKDF